MDTLKTKRMSSTSIKEKTWKTYERNIKQLYDKFFDVGKYQNNDFLEDTDKIQEYLNILGKAKKRLMLSVILIMLSPIKNDPEEIKKPIYLHYLKELRDDTKEASAEASEQKKSIKQSENWVDWNEILNVQKLYKNKVRKQLQIFNTKHELWSDYKPNREIKTLIQDYLIISLYTLIAPRRLDYANMKMLTLKRYNNLSQDAKETFNYLIHNGRNRKTFSFGKQAQKNRNIDRNGIQQSVYILKVPPALNTVINTYLKWNGFEETSANWVRILLKNTRGDPITTDGLSKWIIKILKENFPNKNITPTMLRTIYLTDLQKDDTALLKKQSTAEEMGHSIAVAEKHYVKH